MQNVPRLDQIHLDSQALGFTLGLSLLTSLVFGLIPALRISRPNLLELLKEGGLTASGGQRSRRVSQTLVIAEMALALVLLIGSSLLVRSFLHLQAVDLGFNPNDTLAVRLRLNPAQYQGQQVTAFYRQLIERIETLPEVKSVGAGFPWAFPLRAGNSTWSLDIEGRPAPTNTAEITVGWRQVTPDFFRVLEIPLIRGRLFGEQDHRESQIAVIINQALARRFFPEDDPIDRRIRLGGHESLMSIVGVVGDTKLGGLNNPSEGLVVYTSHDQAWRGASGDMWVLARTTTDPLSLVGAVKEHVRAMDKDVPIAEITTMEQIIGDWLTDRRFNMFLLGILAMVAIALAVVGIYGVMAHAVSQRTREIGLRIALGARRHDVLRLIVGQGMKLALIGVAAGLLAASWLTDVMAHLLFGVSATDPLTFAIIPLLLALVALLACWLPARRATKMDPMTALRYE